MLSRAVSEMQQGLVEASLSDFVYKKRVARSGQGKRGSTRTSLAFKKGDMANINESELRQLKLLAKKFLSYRNTELRIAMKEKELIEVSNHE